MPGGAAPTPDRAVGVCGHAGAHGVADVIPNSVADERPERPEEGGPEPGRVVLAARVAVSQIVVLQVQDLEGRRVPGPQRAAEFHY